MHKWNHLMITFEKFFFLFFEEIEFDKLITTTFYQPNSPDSLFFIFKKGLCIYTFDGNASYVCLRGPKVIKCHK